MEKAKDSFKKVSRLSYGHYPSYFNLALISLLQEKYAESLKYLEEAKKLNPFDIRIDALLSSANLMTEKYPEARAAIQEAITKQPGDIFAHKKLGLVFLDENNVNGATGEFTLTKNLSPSDKDANMLLSASYALANDHEKALEKIKDLKDLLTEEHELAFYALLLEKNNLNDQANSIFITIPNVDKTQIVKNIISVLQKNVVHAELAAIPPIREYENPSVAKRMAEKLKQKELRSGPPETTQTAAEARPFNLKGTITEKFEFYDRTTKSSSPINSMNVTSNLKLEGKSEETGIAAKAEVEGFYNRWDKHVFDYYKLNITKDENLEIDTGKFSPKRFPTLVSFPTVQDGVHIWKRFAPSAFEPTSAPEVSLQADEPVNLGEIYRVHHTDGRSFKDIEITAVMGRTLERINLDERKEKNEGSYESSGQFEQWTQSYRIHSEINRFLELGSSFSITQDISGQANVASSTLPVESIATGIDGGIDLLDNDLNIDGEVAFSNFDADTLDMTTKHRRDIAWLFKTKYKIFETASFSYEQKSIGRNFEVEGASQTKDRLSHTLDFVYKPKNPRTWLIQSQQFQYKPEIESADGGGDNKERFTTFQSVTEFKLPQDNKYTFDYKYYSEKSKCGCTDYDTLTFKYSLEWKIPSIKTTLKPSYMFERKDDMISAPTDEKNREYIFSIENTAIKNLKLNYSWEREKRQYDGATTKSYHQYINSVEAKYTFIPSRLDMKIKASEDYKNPSDTNKTNITVLAYELNYTSKDRNDIFNIKYERKNNIYMPWADNSAYRQNYVDFKYTHKF